MRRYVSPAAAMASIVGVDKPKRKKRKPSGATAMTKSTNEAREFLESKDWGDAQARHLLGLYAVLHEDVYGVEPEELADAWLPALSAAMKLEREIGMESAVDFLRWTWREERAREAKVAGTGVVRRRVGWYLQFAHRSLLVDFRRAVMVTSRRKR